MPPLSEIIHVLLAAVLPALAVSACVMAVVLLLCGARQAFLAVALGLGVGAGVGLWQCDALTLISADSSWNRLPWAALAALWVTRVARVLEPAAGILLRAITSFVIALLVLPAESRKETEWLVPTFAALLFLLWVLLERVAVEIPGGSVPFAVAVIMLSAGVVLVHAGSARLMNAAVVLASALMGVALVAWWRCVDAGGALPAAAVLLPGLLLMGQQETFSELPWYVFALPALAPLLMAEALPLSHWQSRRARLARALLMLVLVVIPLATALYLANQIAPLEFD